MPTRAPHTVGAVWPEPRPGRLAATLQRESPLGCRCALLGLPDDLGVELNAGRPGAAAGPSAFRAAFSRFGVGWDGLARRALGVGIFDAGDVEPAPGGDAAALVETHERIERAAGFLHEQGLVTICIGGGHDLSLPSISALSCHVGQALGGINLDAHLDVRERVGSGMAFRRLIERQHLDPTRFLELGLGRFANDASDIEWLERQGASLIYADSIFDTGLDPARLLEQSCAKGPAFLSIDLDALDQSAAPGVSAPNALGIDLRDAVRLAESAGAHPAILHFDLMELNPSYDPDGRTARSAVLLFLYFVAGLCQRRP
jgi:formimidoylglutamase